MDALPLYEILAGASGQGVHEVAMVASPAIEIGWLAFADAKFHPNCRCQITSAGIVKLAKGACELCRDAKRAYDSARKAGKRLPKGIEWVSPDDLAFRKVEGERMVVAGPLMVPDTAIYRRDPDGREYSVFFSRETVETLAKRFLKERRTTALNEEHTDTPVPAYIAESWIVEDPAIDKSAKLGFSVPKGTWFATVQVEDEAYWVEMVKTGRVRGFSVEGTMAVSKEQTKQTMNEQKFSVTLDNGTVIANSADTDTFTVGEELWVVLPEGEKVPAEDGEYALPDGSVIDAVGGMIAAVRPAEEAEMASEPNAEFEALRAETAATLADLSNRVAGLEAKLAEAETTMASQKEQLAKFAAATPGARSVTVRMPAPAPAKESKTQTMLAAFEAVENYRKSTR